MTQPASTARPLVWIAMLLVPVVAWSKDTAVIVLAVTATSVLFQLDARRAALRPGNFLGFLGLATVAFVLWSLTAVLWSPQEALVAWLKWLGVILLTTVLVAGLVNLPGSVLERSHTPVLAAGLGLFLLLLIERETDGLLIRLVRATATRDQAFNLLSAGLAFLSCLAYPLAYFLWRRTGQWSVAMGFVLACFVLGLTYRMDAAPISLASGAIWFAVVWRWRRQGFVCLSLLLAVIVLSWGEIAEIASATGASAWLTAHVGPNWGVRIEIWTHVFELVKAKPVLGYGFDAARDLGQGAVNFLHPHNGLLQVWLELGVIGVALLLAVGAGLVKYLLSRAPDRIVLAVAGGAIGTAMVFFSVSFGLWNGWWLSVLGLTLCAVILVYRDRTQPVG